eukprot:TRINITY_DN4776_c0_g1_i1.p1 TRINITY_DN4776_c0_g1~~TRINITY_DN4776_c0_g1_i1.p1  ORF type:complete len:1165 (+),score=167.57 TRINITY_DN4776_c0_g1_i1:655-4149(+)
MQAIAAVFICALVAVANSQSTVTNAEVSSDAGIALISVWGSGFLSNSSIQCGSSMYSGTLMMGFQNSTFLNATGVFYQIPPDIVPLSTYCTLGAESSPEYVGFSAQIPPAPYSYAPIACGQTGFCDIAGNFSHGLITDVLCASCGSLLSSSAQQLRFTVFPLAEDAFDSPCVYPLVETGGIYRYLTSVCLLSFNYRVSNNNSVQDASYFFGLQYAGPAVGGRFVYLQSSVSLYTISTVTVTSFAAVGCSVMENVTLSGISVRMFVPQCVGVQPMNVTIQLASSLVVIQFAIVQPAAVSGLPQLQALAASGIMRMPDTLTDATLVLGTIILLPNTTNIQCDVSCLTWSDLQPQQTLMQLVQFPWVTALPLYFSLVGHCHELRGMVACLSSELCGWCQFSGQCLNIEQQQNRSSCVAGWYTQQDVYYPNIYDPVLPLADTVSLCLSVINVNRVRWCDTNGQIPGCFRSCPARFSNFPITPQQSTRFYCGPNATFCSNTPCSVAGEPCLAPEPLSCQTCAVRGQRYDPIYRGCSPGLDLLCPCNTSTNARECAAAVGNLAHCVWCTSSDSCVPTASCAAGQSVDPCASFSASASECLAVYNCYWNSQQNICWSNSDAGAGFTTNPQSLNPASCAACLQIHNGHVWCPGTRQCVPQHDCPDGLFWECSPGSMVANNEDIAAPDVCQSVLSCHAMQQLYVSGVYQQGQMYCGWCWDDNTGRTGNWSETWQGSCQRWQFVTQQCNVLLSRKQIATAVVIAFIVYAVLLLVVIGACSRRSSIRSARPLTISIASLKAQSDAHPTTSVTLWTRFRSVFSHLMNEHGIWVSFLLKKCINMMTFVLLVAYFFPLTAYDSITIAGLVCLVGMVGSCFLVCWEMLLVYGKLTNFALFQSSFWVVLLSSMAIEIVAFVVMMANGWAFIVVYSGSGVEELDTGQIASVCLSLAASLISYLFVYQVYRSLSILYALTESSNESLRLLSQQPQQLKLQQLLDHGSPLSRRGEHLAFGLKRLMNLVVNVVALFTVAQLLTETDSDCAAESIICNGAIFQAFTALTLLPFCLSLVILALASRRSFASSTDDHRLFKRISAAVYVLSMCGQVIAVLLVVISPLIPFNFALPDDSKVLLTTTAADLASVFYVKSTVNALCDPKTSTLEATGLGEGLLSKRSDRP